MVGNIGSFASRVQQLMQGGMGGQNPQQGQVTSDQLQAMQQQFGQVIKAQEDKINQLAQQNGGGDSKATEEKVAQALDAQKQQFGEALKAMDKKYQDAFKQLASKGGGGGQDSGQ